MKGLGLMVGLMAATFVAANAQAAADGTHPFDGVWTETVIAESPSCAATVEGKFTIKKSRMAEAHATGRINPDGSARGTATAGGYTASWTGHFAGNTASGRFRRNDGCVVSWRAVRQ